MCVGLSRIRVRPDDLLAEAGQRRLEIGQERRHWQRKAARAPRDALLDGCTRVGAFVRITLPLVGPGLVATAVFGFIQAWNEYIIAYVLLSSSEKQTLTIWLASFTTQHGTDWGGLMAGATLTALPVVIFFLLVQRQVQGGLTAGAVKG